MCGWASGAHPITGRHVSYTACEVVGRAAHVADADANGKDMNAGAAWAAWAADLVVAKGSGK